MQHIELTTTSGYSWTTSINKKAMRESIENYFLGMFFNIGTFPVEKIEKVVKVRCI